MTSVHRQPWKPFSEFVWYSSAWVMVCSHSETSCLQCVFIKDNLTFCFLWNAGHSWRLLLFPCIGLDMQSSWQWRAVECETGWLGQLDMQSNERDWFVRSVCHAVRLTVMCSWVKETGWLGQFVMQSGWQWCAVEWKRLVCHAVALTMTSSWVKETG